MAYRLAHGGSARARAHVSIGAVDQDAAWSRARAGGACPVLANGPGGVRLGTAVAAFTEQYRLTFPVELGPKAPAAECTAVPTLDAAGARSLDAAARDEATGLEIPPGGLVTPPVAVGVPAQVTLQLGPDPLGLAAALGISSEEFWTAAEATVTARGAGVALAAPVAGDGSATLAVHPHRARRDRPAPRGAGRGRPAGAGRAQRDRGAPAGRARGSRADHARRRRPGHMGARHPARPGRRGRRAARRSEVIAPPAP